MRKVLQTIIILIFVFTISSSAQFGGDLFKAHEGWDAIKDSIGDKHLVMIIAAQALDSPLIIDIENGTSDGWLYLVRSIHDTTQNTLYMVMKDGEEWFYFPIDENMDITEGLKPLDEVSWMDSDQLIGVLNKNQIYSNYINSNPNLWSIEFIIVYYPYDMGDDMPPQFFQKFNWMVEINEELRCVVNSVTGETECETIISDVEVLAENEDFKIYPQPARDVINIQGLAEKNVSSIEIYNLLGQIVYEINSEILGSRSISTQDFKSGTYIIKLTTQTGVETRTISVIK